MTMAAVPNDDDSGDEGQIFNVADDDAVTDTDDGGAIVKLGETEPSTPPVDETDFYRNLAVEIESSVLGQLADQLHQAIKEDIQAREERDKQQAEAIKRTGIGGEAPGGASFMGASKVVHPMLAKAAIDFESRM